MEKAGWQIWQISQEQARGASCTKISPEALSCAATALAGHPATGLPPGRPSRDRAWVHLCLMWRVAVGGLASIVAAETGGDGARRQWQTRQLQGDDCVNEGRCACARASCALTVPPNCDSPAP